MWTFGGYCRRNSRDFTAGWIHELNNVRALAHSLAHVLTSIGLPVAMHFSVLSRTAFATSLPLSRFSPTTLKKCRLPYLLSYPDFCQASRHPVASLSSIATEPSPAPTAHSAPNVIDILHQRGLFDNATADVETLRKLSASQTGVYTGFDPTADSLHLGNLLAIIALAWFQRCGHRVYALVGGATGKVGDPSGKSAERPVLDDDTIARNLAAIEKNLRQILDRSVNDMDRAGRDVPEPVVVNNHDWVGSISFLDFLRDVGKYARVNTMMAKDSVKTRLDSEEGMSFTEFTYQLLQAYDFMHLSDTADVTFQLGGSDQWGNITAGTELTRKLRSRTVYGITFPLLTTADGKKFGKSEKGAVWLTPEKLSPYEFYQYLVRTTDEDVIKFMTRLTFLPLEEINQIEKGMGTEGYVPNTAQKRLAEEVTRIVHGEEGVASALAATAAAAPGSQAVLSVEALEAIAADMPSVTMARAEVAEAMVVDVMVTSGLQKSKGEARRLIRNGGAYINNEKVTDEKAIVSEENLVGGRLVLMGAGKKNKMLVRIE